MTTNLESINHLLWPVQSVSCVIGKSQLRFSYQTVLVIAVPAEGAIVLAMMPYFLPSMANERVSPRIAALAVEYCSAYKYALDMLNIC